VQPRQHGQLVFKQGVTDHNKSSFYKVKLEQFLTKRKEKKRKKKGGGKKKRRGLKKMLSCFKFRRFSLDSAACVWVFVNFI
jgi:hypothetical protein